MLDGDLEFTTESGSPQIFNHVQNFTNISSKFIHYHFWEISWQIKRSNTIYFFASADVTTRTNVAQT